ncbi:cytochrome c oxidase assembly protein COX16 homolog, mitochondrial [Bicyclus anynana]|uniref:Cytochrome c oxidase assembly protein COX16 homolog, mitochondrial n=1 Tax=Bicyclus anynana TaxID=110368 RepID=A0A6J1P5N2_BICAN|nr:cytochrome c oxidase assembly protein COX16 homolog, mitochondrial [Bicyclus anynana]
MTSQQKTRMSLQYLQTIVKNYKKNKFLRYGLPFLIFTVGGSLALKEWTQIRYQFAQVKGMSNAEAEKMGLHRDKKVTLEGVYDEIQKLDIDNWENKRGPRPWEPAEEKKE